MATRKAVKKSTVSIFREAVPDSEDEAPEETVTEWIKSTSRSVHTDVRAKHRIGKKTRFAEDDEEIEVLRTPLDSFYINGAQSGNFAAWLESGVDDDPEPDLDDERDNETLPSRRDSNLHGDDESDEGSTYDKDEDLPMEHDLSGFAADKESQVRCSQLFSYLRNPLMNYCPDQNPFRLGPTTRLSSRRANSYRWHQNTEELRGLRS